MKTLRFLCLVLVLGGCGHNQAADTSVPDVSPTTATADTSGDSGGGTVSPPLVGCIISAGTNKHVDFWPVSMKETTTTVSGVIVCSKGNPDPFAVHGLFAFWFQNYVPYSSCTITPIAIVHDTVNDIYWVRSTLTGSAAVGTPTRLDQIPTSYYK